MPATGAAAARSSVPDFVDKNISIVAALTMLVEGDVVGNVARRFDFDHDEKGRVVMAANRTMLDAHQGGEATDGEADASTLPEVKREFLKGEAGYVSVGEGEAVVALVVRLDVHKDEGVVDVTHAQRASFERRDMVTAAKEHGIA
jgi:hypothetical protein